MCYEGLLGLCDITDMPGLFNQTERTCPRVQRKRECILAIGGAPRLKSDPVNRDISCFDPDTDQWEHLTRLKEPRHHHAGENWERNE